MVEVDFADFTRIVLSVAIIVGSLFISAWLTALQECGQTCNECQRVYDFLDRTGFINRTEIEGSIGSEYPGRNGSIRVEMNVSPWVSDVMACQRGVFNISDFIACQRIAPMTPH